MGGAGLEGGGSGFFCALDDLLVYCRGWSEIDNTKCRGMGGGGDIFC